MKVFNDYEHLIKYVKRNKTIKADVLKIESCNHTFKLKEGWEGFKEYGRLDNENIVIRVDSELKTLMITYQFYNNNSFIEYYKL